MGEEVGTGWASSRTRRSLSQECGAGAWGTDPTCPKKGGQSVSVERDRGTGCRLGDPRPGISACGGARSQPGLEMGGRALRPWAAVVRTPSSGEREEDQGQAPHVALRATGVWAVEREKQMGNCQ